MKVLHKENSCFFDPGGEHKPRKFDSHAVRKVGQKWMSVAEANKREWKEVV